ncbi:MAG: hypothetical protein DMF28_08500 [Verrucomicrobia bacterium]|nr:MAG: hypothetical protein DMF28_08500 [Verrucomicrobiota bacterium]
MTETVGTRNFPPRRVPEGSLGESKMQPIRAEMTSWREKCVKNSNRPGMRRILLSGLIAFLLSAPYAFPLDELVPPFGFRWTDSVRRVEDVLHGAKAKITSREKKQSREVWTVEGLVHPGLKRTVFTFKQRSLVAIELQYEYPDWSIERYNQRMGEIRKYFDEKYGTGKLVSRSRDNDTDVVQTLVGYQWMVGTTMLELFYFSAQHDNLVYRTISVDYKAL